jgi:alanine racemase
VQVDESVNVGDRVEILRDAEEFAKRLSTISYEVLTGFSAFRGETKIE